MKNNEKVNIGMIGLGYWGKNILRNLVELGAVYGACDSNAGVIAERKKDFPNLTYFSDYKQLLADDRMKAVVIAAPAAAHYQLAKDALCRDKDVFVEKPLALTYEHGRELADLAERKGKILMVGHILNYHPALLKMKDLIAGGDLGKIQYVYSNRLNIGKLRVEENILWSFAPHDISAMLMLLEEEPVRVTCFAADYLNENVYDVTLSSFEFKNKVKAHIFVSWLHPFKEQKLVVVGSKAMAVFDDLAKEKLIVYPHTIEWRNGKIPVSNKAEGISVDVEEKEPLKEELKHFIECVASRNTPRTDAKEALRVLKVLEAAEESIRSCSGARTAMENKKHFIHSSAVIDENVDIGEGTKIWHFSHILKNVTIGKNCVVGQNVMIGPDAVVGSNCKIQNNVSLYKGVTLQDDVFCGPSCVFTNVINPRSFIERKDEFKDTLVKKGATIGANATIICGVDIGSYSLVGAGAVVTRDVSDYALVAGVPAKQIGWVCVCGTTLSLRKNNAKCIRCQRRYKFNAGRLSEKK
jgi:UDP-2-acetamido-3-amino-2,3-dideoxy-glucuronate N-acetyltransferase